MIYLLTLRDLPCNYIRISMKCTIIFLKKRFDLSKCRDDDHIYDASIASFYESVHAPPSITRDRGRKEETAPAKTSIQYSRVLRSIRITYTDIRTVRIHTSHYYSQCQHVKGCPKARLLCILVIGPGPGSTQEMVNLVRSVDP